MKIIFVHGWNVTDTNTYGKLPEAIQKEAPIEWGLEVTHIYLGKYISFNDEVTVYDIARAFEAARVAELGFEQEFSCITHSTGAPVLREWVDHFYGKNNLQCLPLKHLIMLAPANHGSALAQLGKSRVSRISAWFNGVEPGQKVLNWLELGSDEQWKLNSEWLDYEFGDHIFPFVLTGQTIDKKLYDYINSYTAEKGSDGVVRVAAANLNYRIVRLEQDNIDSRVLNVIDNVMSAKQKVGLEVIPDASHSGSDKGIMNSVTLRNRHNKQIVKSIVECLSVETEEEYQSQTIEMEHRTTLVQEKSPKYSMLVFRVIDDQGNEIKDFDLYFLAGNDYRPDKLPKGFHVDTQKNKVNNCHLIYYVSHSKMANIKDGKIGFRVVARPENGFCFYRRSEFHSNGVLFDDLLKPNETVMVEITLRRAIDKNTFTLSRMDAEREEFRDQRPSGDSID